MERLKRMISNGGVIVFEENSLSRPKFGNLLHSDPTMSSTSGEQEDYSNRTSYSNYQNRGSSVSAFGQLSTDNSPYNMSPWNQSLSPYTNSPWSKNTLSNSFGGESPPNTLIGSLVREEGHICSLAATGDLLYTGSDSKNIRVWKNQKEFAGFKSSRGLVKAIVISGDRIFIVAALMINIVAIRQEDEGVHAGELLRTRKFKDVVTTLKDKSLSQTTLDKYFISS